MKVIKVIKKASSKTDQLQMVISILCLLNDIKLSKTDIVVLSYYIVYKINSKTDKLILDSEIVKDMNALRNVKTKLKRKGFLKRSELYKSYEVNLSKDFNFEDKEFNILIKIDNN